MTLTQPGVYDYFRVPHEHAGMVGRIIVGAVPTHGWWTAAAGPRGDNSLPAAALNAFPPIEEIVRKKIIRRS